jgi:aldose 1-epimerase
VTLPSHAATGTGVTRREFGRLADGQVVHEYTLDNGRGLTLCAINLGGIVTAIRTPDRDGRLDNVVLGLASLADYEAPNPHFGTIVGRYANRIAHGRFALGDQSIQLDVNDGIHTLHGGPGGFGKRWWHIAPMAVSTDGNVGLELSYCSEHGEQGFPGRMQVEVCYRLSAANEWRIDYRATCDRTTVANLTQHSYFNLAGSGSVLNHHLVIHGNRYCPIDRGLIPEGIADVAGTPFDFRIGHRIEERIRSDHVQLIRARGYDHNWLLDSGGVTDLRLAARLSDPFSGRTMDVETTEPGIQFYSGNFLDGSLVGANGRAYRQGDGLCLETQHFPDSPNHPEFPSTDLRPGQVFASTTLYRFGVQG